MSNYVNEKILTNIELNCKIRRKKGGKEIKNLNSIQEWIPIEKILDNGIIKLKNSKYIKIIKVIPINFNLKSNLEKESILNSYKTFLKTCNFDFQIIIQSNKQDLSKHILNINKNLEENENRKLKDISINYIKYIKEINSEKNSSSKNFYIIISNSEKVVNNKKNNNFDNNLEEIIIEELNEKYFKIKECLSRCGNIINDYSDKKEIIKIIFSFLNSKKYLNK